MSNDLKKMRRKAMTEMARTNRKQTQGGGALRRTVKGWVWVQKRTLYDLYWQQQDASALPTTEGVTPC